MEKKVKYDTNYKEDRCTLREMRSMKKKKGVEDMM